MMEGMGILRFSGIMFPGRPVIDVGAGGIIWNILNGFLLLD
jgi:hypothetical protein